MSMESTKEYLPYFAEGTVVSGYGRGSKELGIPTANFPEDVIRRLPDQFECGVYYGWAKVGCSEDVHKMVMCVGWNPYYHNTVKTMETHIMHRFPADFYGDHLKIVVLGYIRPMCDFKSLDDLITAIHQDIASANRMLDIGEHLRYRDHQFFRTAVPAPAPCVAGDATLGGPGDADQNEEGTPVDANTFQKKLEKGVVFKGGMSCSLAPDPANPGRYIMTCDNNENRRCEEGDKSSTVHVRQTSCSEGEVKSSDLKDMKTSPCAQEGTAVDISPATLVNGHVNVEENDCAINYNNNNNNSSSSTAASICKL